MFQIISNAPIEKNSSIFSYIVCGIIEMDCKCIKNSIWLHAYISKAWQPRRWVEI